MRKYIIISNGTDWCDASWSKASMYENISYIDGDLIDNFNIIARQAFRLVFSTKYKIGKYLPGRKYWADKCLNLLPRCEQSVIIVYDRSRIGNDRFLLNQLKRKYPGSKFVYVFTNVVRFSGARENNLVKELNNMYDAVMAFDPCDAKAYGFSYSPLVYDPLPLPKTDISTDVFYLGNAKDRLDILHKWYKEFTEKGLICDFNIVGVDKEKQMVGPGLHYNTPMSYSEALKRISRSRALFEVPQADSNGWTIKTCESVLYDKLLLTTNKNIADAPFFESKAVKVLDEASRNQNWAEMEEVYYSDESKGYFSIRSFLKRVDFALSS